MKAKTKPVTVPTFTPLSVTSALENTIVTTAQGGAKGGTAVAPVVAVTVANQDSIARIGTGTGLLAFAALHPWPRALATALLQATRR